MFQLGSFKNKPLTTLTDRLYIFHIGYGHGHDIVMVIERLWFYMVI